MIVPFTCSACNAHVAAVKNPETGVVVCPDCGDRTVVGREIGPGVILGKGFRLDRRLAQTSGGTVFLAYQTVMQRRVVVKTLDPAVVYDEETFGRFQREMALTAKLNHPRVLAALDAGADCGIYFLATEYRPGQTLKQHLAQAGGRLDERQALGLLIPVAEALDYAWTEHRIVHRNVKPSSLWVSEDGEAMLMDWGIAKSLSTGDSSTLTVSGFTVGTPQYMSPEQFRTPRDLDFRTDVYSLGIVLYECLTGARPFDDPQPIRVYEKHIGEKPLPPQHKQPEVSQACSDLVLRLLAKDRNDRPASWKDVIEAMKKVRAIDPRQRERARRAAQLRVARNASEVVNRSRQAQHSDRSATVALLVALFAVLILTILIVFGLVVLRNRQRGQATDEGRRPAIAATVTPL